MLEVYITRGGSMRWVCVNLARFFLRRIGCSTIDIDFFMSEQGYRRQPL